MGTVNEFLVVYLDSIHERLLDYLDDDQELRLDTVERMHSYTGALLDGSLAPAAVAEDWPDWFDLAPAFVTAYGPQWMEVLEETAAFLDGPEIGDDAPLTEQDRTYLVALEPLLDLYPELRKAEE